MKEYLIEFKPFLVFLGKFLLVYLVLTFAYQHYLSGFDSVNNEVDGITNTVANQTRKMLLFFGADVKTMPNLQEPSVLLQYNEHWVARIIEGCNAISVIILFVAFVIAFSGKFWKTIVFISIGSVLIYVMNVSRIALLAVLIYYYKPYSEFLHGVLFPLIIYGFVFMLWVIWVNKFSNYAKKTTKE